MGTLQQNYVLPQQSAESPRTIIYISSAVHDTCRHIVMSIVIFVSIISYRLTRQAPSRLDNILGEPAYLSVRPVPIYVRFVTSRPLSLSLSLLMTCSQ